MTEIDKNKKNNGNKLLKEAFGFLETIALFVVPVFILMSFYLHNVKVDGSSMEPTLQNKDDLFVTSYVFSSPKALDIVVVTDVDVGRSGVHNIIKRIIAVQGQKVKIDFEKGNVYVDGVLLDEPYINEATTTPESMRSNVEVTVPEECYFVMGDNRNHSDDSRNKKIGMIKREQIMGKAKFRKWPLLPITFF